MDMDREKVIKKAERIMCSTVDRDVIDSFCEDVIDLLKEQEESIPISWLKEKLEDHPELSYAVTDGIINVLDLWEGR